jgi:mannosyltransferase
MHNPRGVGPGSDGLCVRGLVSCFGGVRESVTSERRLLRLGHREFDGSGRIDPLVPVLMAVGFVIDLVRGGSKSVWLDEAISVSYAREGFGQFLHTASHRDPNMGLYYLLLRPWTAIFGESESAIRSLSAVFAALAVGAVAVLGRRLFDRWTGLIAGLFLALNAFFVEYAQTARSYTLLVLLVVLSSYFFVAELERPSLGSAVGYVVSSALAVYAHYFAVYALVAQLLTLAVVKRRRALTRRWVAIGCSIVVLCVPELVFAARSGAGNISWITQPRLFDLVNLPVVLSSSRVIALMFVCLAGYALAVRPRKDGVQRDRGWQIGFVIAWFALPVLASFAVSFSVPMFVPYYLLVSLPGLLLAGAAGVVRLPNRVASAILVLLLAGGMAKELHRWYAAPTIENYRSAVHAIQSRARVGDAIVPAPVYTEPAVAYYLKRSGSRAPAVADPGSGSDLGTHAPRIWLILRGASPAETAQLYKTLARGYKRTDTRLDFPGLSVTLYTQSPDR